MKTLNYRMYTENDIHPTVSNERFEGSIEELIRSAKNLRRNLGAKYVMLSVLDTETEDYYMMKITKKNKKLIKKL